MIGRRAWPMLSVLVVGHAVLGSIPAQETKSYKPAQPLPCPQGYPIDLVLVPSGAVKVGQPAKEIRELSKEYGLGDPEREMQGMKRIVRELGSGEQVLDDFLIGRFEVTNEQYEAYVKANTPKVRFPFDWWLPEDERKHREEFFKNNKDRKVDFKPLTYWQENHNKGLKWKVPDGHERFPVTYVSWREAQGYCAWAGLRLPTEVEWQRACAMDKQLRFLWGKKWERDALKVLDYDSPRGLRKRAVGANPALGSLAGVDDMIGNVWEWTASFYLEHEGYKNEWKSFQSLLKADKAAPPPEPLSDAAKRVIKGGSFLVASQGMLAFRPSTRRPLPPEETVEDLGFRVAKSPQPGLDSTALRYREEFTATALGDRTLDLPTAADLRLASKGKARTYEQRGIERWDLDGDKIRSYHMVSVVPVFELKYKHEKELADDSSSKVVGGVHGTPVFALFSTEPLRAQQGAGKFVALDPGIYVVSYRAGGLPDELVLAMKTGSADLKLHKGKRPDPNAAPASDDKKDDKKKDKKKEGDKVAEAEDPAQRGKWMEIVDRYGVPDEVTMRYPASQPSEIVLQPGGLKIPVSKSLLLFRKHDGDYVAWAEYMPAITKALAARSEPELQITEGTSKLVYVGGPRTVVSTYRFVFHLELRLADGEFNKVWIRPDSFKDHITSVRKGDKPQTLASPTGEQGKQPEKQ